MNGVQQRRYRAGLTTVLANRIAPVAVSLTRNRNGRLIVSLSVGAATDEPTSLPVAAAASVP